MWKPRRLWGLVALAALSHPAQAARPLPVERTTAYQLFVAESQVRDVPENGLRDLVQIIDDATRAVSDRPRRPAREEDALAVFKAIDDALARHNLIQPARRSEWVETMGEALTPHRLPASELEFQLNSGENVGRKLVFDRRRPTYFVDCDMGAQLFLAVAERMGWDVRLVEIPDHNFVRWHLAPNVTVNWDWTHERSICDGEYAATFSQTQMERDRGVYMRSFTTDEARGYYLGLIASHAKSSGDAQRLFEQAIQLSPFDHHTQNNIAWFYVTRPEFAKAKASVALGYATAAWSLQPDDPNVADTVACAWQAAGNNAMALAIESYAAAKSHEFDKDLTRIHDKQLCAP